MRVFVTGGHGFIGSSVVRQLLEQGYEVRCLVRPTSDTSRIDGLAWERFEGDVRDIECLKKGIAAGFRGRRRTRLRRPPSAPAS